MKQIKDIKIIVLILILAVFTIGYFIIANKVSYAFEVNYDLKDIEDNKISVIKKCAETYGRDHKEDFNDEGLIYITVQNLIDEGYLASNSDGKIISLNDTSMEFNDKKIRIKLDNDKILAEIYS